METLLCSLALSFFSMSNQMDDSDYYLNVRRTDFDYMTLQLNYAIRKTYPGFLPIGNRFWYLISARRILGPGALGPFNLANPVANFNFTYAILHPDGTTSMNSLPWGAMKRRRFPTGLGIGEHIFTGWDDVETTFNDILKDRENYRMYSDRIIKDMVPEDVGDIVKRYTQKRRKT